MQIQGISKNSHNFIFQQCGFRQAWLGSVAECCRTIFCSFLGGQVSKLLYQALPSWRTATDSFISVGTPLFNVDLQFLLSRRWHLFSYLLNLGLAMCLLQSMGCQQIRCRQRHEKHQCLFFLGVLCTLWSLYVEFKASQPVDDEHVSQLSQYPG